MFKPSNSENSASPNSGLPQKSPEQHLVDACIAGVPKSWDALYAKYHHIMVRVIRAASHSSTDFDGVDEIVARVWYRLVTNNGAQLSRFDPSRGSLGTFLGRIARSEASSYFRSEKRRRNREHVASRPDVQPTVIGERQVMSVLDDFMDTLGPRESEFCTDALVNQDDSDSYSQASVWQFRSRIRCKLKKFLH